MSYEILRHEGFTVVGPSIRTDNARNGFVPNGQSIKFGTHHVPADIVTFWTEVFKSNILAMIPHRVGDYVYGVYSDYAEEYNPMTAYSLTAGPHVSSTEGLPTGMMVREIPAGLYAVYTVDKPEEIAQAWITIWDTIDLNRSFEYDFEEYGAKDGKIRIFIGLSED